MVKVSLPVGIAPIRTVNYHLLKACNMSCRFCFARFADTQGPGKLSCEDSLKLVEMLCQSGFEKINFAGGEPTLAPWLPDLVRRAKSCGLETSIVTNGSKLDDDWLDDLAGSLDIIALSIDSVDPAVQRRIGRVAHNEDPMSAERYLQLAKSIGQRNICLKVNTVVNRHNIHEDFRRFILDMKPERWKIFQALPVAGQNDTGFDDMAVTPEEFESYVSLNCSVEDHRIRVVPENNEAMTGSYVMVSPDGKFYDNTKGRHTYSDPILDVGVEAALKQVDVFPDRFRERGGDWSPKGG